MSWTLDTRFNNVYVYVYDSSESSRPSGLGVDYDVESVGLLEERLEERSEESIFQQLKAFAERSRNSSLLSVVSPTDSLYDISDSLDDYTDVDSDDYMNDDMEYEMISSTSVAETPCPRHTETNSTANNTRLDFTSITALRHEERKKSHKWSSEDRLLLSCLYRWFDSSTDTTAIPRIFNTLTSLNLKYSTIRRQFEDSMVLFGPDAYPELRIFYSAFDDPRYEDILAMISSEAKKLKIHLPRRLGDVDFGPAFGKARRARSKRTRERYNDLVRRAQLLAAQTSRSLSQRSTAFGGCLLASQDVTDQFVVADENAKSIQRIRRSRYETFTPNMYLAFRIWVDGENWTIYNPNDGFISARFAELGGLHDEDAPVMCPRLLKSHIHQHLHPTGGPSPFVSVFVNLLQTMAKYRTPNTRIAVIDLAHHSLSAGDKKFHVRDKLADLRSNHNLMQWTRYKGFFEFLLWGDIPPAAILHVTSWSDLTRLASTDPDVAHILSLPIFERLNTSSRIAKHIARKALALDDNTARSIGVLARAFGLDNPTVKSRHVADFVATFIEGWSIRSSSRLSNNKATILNALAVSFAAGLNRPETPFDPKAAFVDGVIRAWTL
ncbi:hypothetical protein CC78DRAFT_622481 [Lojkania enalia]|uniref:DUF7587 domain-containing protein n=1 Tax=Lojkania enalia TaxID=147567 RepID=A0A9P4MUB6_9PLEO|nr:hypothetical protein CC78DRAFT_622481 [Didymosphaeria enalia]